MSDASKPERQARQRTDAEGPQEAASENDEELLNALLCDYFLDSNTGAVDRLVSHLTAELSAADAGPSTRYPEKYARALKALVLNLFRAYNIGPNKYVGLAMRPEAFYQATKYSPRETSYPVVARIIKAMVKLGFIEQAPGFYDRRSGIGFRTRIKALPKSHALFAKYGLKHHMVFRSPEAPVIVLRDSDEKKSRLEYADTDEVVRMRTQAQRINEFLGKSFIGLYITDRELAQLAELKPIGDDENADLWKGTGVDLTQRQLFRVFNDASWHKVGRFYGGWWQHIPSDLRKHIYLASPGDKFPSQTVEVDFDSNLPSLAYGYIQQPRPSNIYEIPGLQSRDPKKSRDIAKAAMLRMLNCSSRPEAVGSLVKYYREENVPDDFPLPELVIAQLEEVHEPIKGLMYIGKGKELMLTESKIAERVMVDMMKQGIVVLPVHDSFLVARAHQGKLEASMRAAYRDLANVDAVLTVDETEAQFLRNKKHVGLTPEEAELFDATQRKQEVSLTREISALSRSGAPMQEVLALVNRLRENVPMDTFGRVAQEMGLELQLSARERESALFWDDFDNWASRRPS